MVNGPPSNPRSAGIGATASGLLGAAGASPTPSTNSSSTRLGASDAGAKLSRRMDRKEVKSAYELALERLDRDGIERPRREALTDDVRARMAETRQRAEAKLAELEILHQKKARSIADAAERERADEEYRIERRRIEERRDRDLERLRGAS